MLADLLNDALGFARELLLTQRSRLLVDAVDEATVVTGRQVAEQASVPIDDRPTRDVLDVNGGVEGDVLVSRRRVGPLRPQRLGPVHDPFWLLLVKLVLLLLVV